MSFSLINQYIIVIQMISHDIIKYSYCITHIFNKFTYILAVDHITVDNGHILALRAHYS